MLRVPRRREVAVWAAVGGTVLSVVTQIVAAKTLSEGIGRLAKNDIRKDMSGETENKLARGESGTVGLNELPLVVVSIPSDKIVGSTAMGVSDISERGGEEIQVWSLEMEAFTEEKGGGIIKGGESGQG